jgi:NAD+ diphosphatase
MAPREDARALNFLFQSGHLLVAKEEYGLPQGGLGLDLVPPARLQPVGLLDGHYCRTAWVDEGVPPPPGYQYANLRSLFGALDEAMLAVAGRAAQLAEWARTHQFCGACAKPTEPVAGERCRRCPACGMMAYPRISPAMMVLVRKGEQVLLALHANSATKRYTALAGFLEAGETVEEAVHREVWEEVGLRVHNLRYFGSQSWPFPHSLMLAFTAEYLEGEIRVDPAEIADARWFGPRDAWPERVTPVSIASLLIDAHRPRVG